MMSEKEILPVDKKKAKGVFLWVVAGLALYQLVLGHLHIAFAEFGTTKYSFYPFNETKHTIEWYVYYLCSNLQEVLLSFLLFKVVALLHSKVATFVASLHLSICIAGLFSWALFYNQYHKWYLLFIVFGLFLYPLFRFKKL